MQHQNITNSEYYQLHGELTPERIEELLEIEENSCDYGGIEVELDELSRMIEKGSTATAVLRKLMSIRREYY